MASNDIAISPDLELQRIAERAARQIDDDVRHRSDTRFVLLVANDTQLFKVHNSTREDADEIITTAYEEMENFDTVKEL